MNQEAFDWAEAQERERSIDEQFAEWSRQHPDVLSMFRRFAGDLREKGHKRIGAKLITERIRFERLTSAHGASSPCINNNFTSRLARWLIAQEPSYGDFFELRVLKADGKSEK